MVDGFLNDTVEVVLFDATGTVINPSPPADEVYFRVAQDLGSSLSQETISQRFAEALGSHFNGSADRLELVRPETSEQAERTRWQAIVGDTICDLANDTSQLAFETLWTHFSEPDAWTVFDDVQETFEGLIARGLKIAIASNFDSRLLQVVRGKPPLASICECFTSSQLGFSKPDPRFYQAICDHFAIQPDRVLMIGDSLTNDVTGAVAAGMPAIHLKRSLSEANDRTVHRLSDLL